MNELYYASQPLLNLSSFLAQNWSIIEPLVLGVATALGILLVTNYQIGLICLVFALILIILTRMVSVGAIAAAILFPVLTLFLPKENFIVSGNYFIYSILIALIVVFNHRANVKRLLNGTENTLSFNKTKEN